MTEERTRIAFVLPNRTAPGKPFTERENKVFWHCLKTLSSFTMRHRYLYLSDYSSLSSLTETEREVKFFFLMGSKLFPLLAQQESFTDLMGSIIPIGDIFFLSTYSPEELQRKRFELRGGGVNFYETFFKHIEKVLRFEREGFTLPPEHFNIAPTVAEVQEFIRTGVARGELFACDLETTSLNRYYGQIVMLGMARNRSDALCVPFLDGRNGPYFRPAAWFSVKKELSFLFTHGRTMW